MKTSIFLSLLVSMQNCHCAVSSNDKQSLPAGKPYNLKSNEDDKWHLNGLSQVADGIALTLREDPPYNIIGNVLSKSFGTGAKTPTVSQIVDYELPLIIVVSFSLLAALVIPIVGLIFCCCRHAGKCGGSMEEEELKLHPRKERIGYSIGIVLCAFFLLLAAGFIFSSSLKMHDSVPLTRTVWKDSLSDIQIYTDNLIKDLDYILIHKALPVIDKLLLRVTAIGLDIGLSLYQHGEPLFEDLFQHVLAIDNTIAEMVYLFREIDDAVLSLVSHGDNIQQELETARGNLSEARDQCRKDLPVASTAECNKIPLGDMLSTEANFTKVPNVTVEQHKIEDAAKANLSEEVIKGNESVHNIPEKVQNLTTNVTTEFQNFSSSIEDLQDTLLKPLEDQIKEFIENSLNPVRDDVDDNYLGSDGMVTKYDTYRHTIFVLIASLTLLDALLLITAVLLGLIGSRRYDTPSCRSSLADWGGRLLLGAAGLLFFSAFLVNLMTGILFFVGSNVAIVCKQVPDYTLLEKTIDDPKIMGEYILSKMLFKDGSVPLTTSEVLRKCSRNQAPWVVLKLDNWRNLSKILDYKDKIPHVDEVFATLNETIQDTSFLSDKAMASLNDSFDAGVHKINFTQYYEQVNRPVVSVPLSPYASNISKAADNFKSTSSKTSDLLLATATELELLDRTTVTLTKKKMVHLAQRVRLLQQKSHFLVRTFEDVMTAIGRVRHFFENVVPVIAAQGVLKHWNEVFGSVDAFIALFIQLVRLDVGRCKPLSNMYQGLTSSLCTHYAAGMNASWVALGLNALVLLIAIILCVRASKHFRRFSNFQEIDPKPDAETVRLKQMKRLGEEGFLLS